MVKKKVTKRKSKKEVEIKSPDISSINTDDLMFLEGIKYLTLEKYKELEAYRKLVYKIISKYGITEEYDTGSWASDFVYDECTTVKALIRGLTEQQRLKELSLK